MAYTADIQIGVKGANQLRELQNRLEKISQEIDLIGARDLFENKAIQSINAYNRALSLAKDNLQDVTLGSEQETAAIREYVQALGDANAARARQNRLIRSQIAAQEAARRTISPGPTGFTSAEFSPALPPSLLRAGEVKQSWNTFFGKAEEVAQDLSRATQTRENAIKQSWNIFFGKAEEVAADLNRVAKARESQIKQSWSVFFSQAQEVATDLNQQAKVRALNVRSSWARFFREVEEFAEDQTRQAKEARQRSGQGRLGAAAIGAGFPLLFGGGPGAILGGGIGGALGGKEFGFQASLGLSALGTVLDRLVGSARNLGDALKAPESALDALQDIGFKVSASTEAQVRSLIKAGDRTEAYNLLLQETGVRPEQVNALRDLDDAFDELQGEFATLFVTIASELTPAIVVVAGLITKLVKNLTGPDVQRAAKNLDPKAFEQARGQAIRETSFFGFFGNREKFEKRLTELSREIVKNAAPGIAIDPSRQGGNGGGDNTKVNTLAEELILQQKIGAAITAGNNLLDKNAFLAAENVIAARLVLALKKAEGDEQKEAIAFQEARNAMGRLEARRIQQQTSLTEKQTREQERAERIAERTNKRIQQQDVTSTNRLAVSQAQLRIQQEDNDLAKIHLQFDLKRDNLQRKYNQDLSKATSALQRNNLELTLRADQEKLSLERNAAVVDHYREQFESLTKVSAEFLKLSPFTKGLSDEFKDMASTINNEILSGIQGMIDGTKTLGEVASSMLRQIANQMLQTAVMGPKGSGGIAGMIFGALGIGGGGGPSGFAPKMAFDFKNAPNLFENPIDTSFLTFANGGRPPVGKPSIVGERGPELFVPRSSGTIVPNNAMGGSTNVVVNVDAKGTAAQGNDANADQLGRVIGAAVQAELIKQKRPGGLLTR